MIAVTETTRPAGSTNTGETEQGSATRSDSSLFIEARRYADERGLPISHSKLSRLVRGYRREVAALAHRGPALTLPTYLRRVVGIPADPTGNTAVRNVMRRGGAAHARA